MTGTAPAQAERRLFDGVLSCELVLPAALLPAAGPDRQAQAAALLGALAQVEDLRKDEPGDEHGELPLLAQRMDAKLDLILALLGRLARQADGLPERALRWSARGLRLELDTATAPSPGDPVRLRLQPADWLPDLVELPASAIAREDRDGATRVWIAFDALRADLAEAMERHLFRLHRRQVAEQRRR